jgi:hypothetical protein
MVHENRNLAGRLIGLIESNAEQLTRSTVESLRTNPRTRSYRTLSSDDLYSRVYDVYHDLGLWLFEKADGAIQSRFNEMGEMRFKQGVPLHEVLWAMILTKNHLRNHLAAWALADSAVELHRQRELDQAIAQFFDRAMYYTTEGYERMLDGAKRNGHSESSGREDLSPAGGHGQTHGGWIL